MKKKLVIITSCFLMLLTTACGSNPKLENGEEVIASVDGKEITADELYNDLKSSYGYDSLLNMIDLYIAEKEIETTKELEQYTQEVVDYYKQYAEMLQVDFETFLATYVGLPNISTEEEFYDYVMKDRKLTLVIERQIKESFTDKDIEKYYNENYSERLTVRHILIEIEESDKDGEKALKQAKDLIKKLEKADKDKVEKKFIELAEEYSDDSSYSNGGLIEDFMSSTVVKEFWEASDKLKDGEYTTKPVKSQYGYHIIYRVSAEDKPSLKDSKEEILTAMTEKVLATDELARYIAMKDLREKYNIKIYDTDIESSYNEFLKQLEENNK